MRTPVMEMFGLEAPIFAFSHCRDVVAAVSRSGGMGTLGTSHFTVEELEVELSWIDAHIDGKPYGVDVQIPYRQPTQFEALTPETARSHLPPAHVEFVEKVLREHGVPELPKEQSEEIFRHYMANLTRTHREAERRLEVVYRHPLARMVVSALGPPPAHIVERAHSLGLKVAGLIGHPKHAKRQVELGVDIIIAQGWEAAGHTGEISTLVLTPEVVDIVDPMPVLAAGGIGRGRQMAAAMSLGAQGVWCGTVWLGTVESEVSPELKKKLFEASSSDTMRSSCSTGKPARRLVSEWVTAWESPDAPKPLPMPLQSILTNEALERITRFKPDRLLTYPAGQVVGQLRGETTGKQVMLDMLTEFSETLERLNRFAEV